MVLRGKVLVAIQFLCLTVLAFIPYSHKRTSLTDVSGKILIFVALIILFIAGVNLRPALTIMPEPKNGAPFITKGIYKFIRHPMYLGVILIAIGVTLIKLSLVGVVFTAILIIDLEIKHRYEDRLLLEKWPQAREYQRTVGALFPRIRRSMIP
jgi:protein-S-isoprenylcysteine O-methyltransferase Ste14